MPLLLLLVIILVFLLGFPFHWLGIWCQAFHLSWQVQVRWKVFFMSNQSKVPVPHSCWGGDGKHFIRAAGCISKSAGPNLDGDLLSSLSSLKHMQMTPNCGGVNERHALQPGLLFISHNAVCVGGIIGLDWTPWSFLLSPNFTTLKVPIHVLFMKCITKRTPSRHFLGYDVNACDMRNRGISNGLATLREQLHQHFYYFCRCSSKASALSPSLQRPAAPVRFNEIQFVEPSLQRITETLH